MMVPIRIILRYSLVILPGITATINARAQSKWQRMLGIEVQNTTLTNVKKSHPNLHSFAYLSKIAPSPYIMIGRSFNKNLSLHFGLQYQHFSNTTTTNYFLGPATNVINTLEWTFHYIGLPIMLHHELWHQNKNSFSVGLGIVNKVPIVQKQSYDGFWHLRGTDAPELAPQFTIDGKFTLQYQYKWNAKNSIGIDLFVANGLNGFFGKIYTGPGAPHYADSKIFYYGSGLRYNF